jgi:lysophospholipase L1-like esterase
MGWHRWFSTLASLALVTLVSLPAASGRLASAAAEPVCLALGDSLSVGLGATLPRKRAYPRLVCNLLARATGRPARLVTLALPGETTQSFLQGDQLTRLRDELARLRSQQAEIRAVMLSLGGNDLLELRDVSPEERQLGLDRFRQEYPAALATLRALLGPDPPLVVTTVYDLSEGNPTAVRTDAWWVAEFNAVVRQAASQEGARVADLEAAFRGHVGEWTWYPADVHPTNAGHEQIARLVWRALGVDIVPPRVEIEQPVAGQLPRRFATLRVRATDNVGVERVELEAGDRPPVELRYHPEQGVWLALWDSAGAPGEVTLSIRAYDVAGHVGIARVTVIPFGGTP